MIEHTVLCYDRQVTGVFSLLRAFAKRNLTR